MTDKERHEDETLKNCIQEAYGCSDDQLLAELAEIDKTLSESDFPGVEDRIMSRLKARMVEEEAEKEVEVDSDSEVSVAQVEAPGSDTEAAPCTEVPEKKVVRIGKKKIALVAVLVAAFVGVLGVSASGGKNYFLKKGVNEIGVVFDNERNLTSISNLESAYKEIESTFGNVFFVLGYIPVDMNLIGMECSSDNISMEFEYLGNRLFLIENKKSIESSICIESDRDKRSSVKNTWLGMDLEYSENQLDNGDIEFGVAISSKDVLCCFFGKMEREEFEKIIKNINYY